MRFLSTRHPAKPQQLRMVRDHFCNQEMQQMWPDEPNQVCRYALRAQHHKKKDSEFLSVGHAALIPLILTFTLHDLMLNHFTLLFGLNHFLFCFMFHTLGHGVPRYLVKHYFKCFCEDIFG